MNLELVGALNELERERGISKDILMEAIEAAILSAYKRSNEEVEHVRVEVSETTGSIHVFSQKQVVEEVDDDVNEISLEAAKRLDPNHDVGGIVEFDVTPKDFGRIAAQTAKQVVFQRIREAERTLIYEEYINREGDVITGIVQRSEYRNILVDLGKVEAILPPGEQMAKENYEHGARLKVYIGEVRQTSKGPQVIVSRTHPGLLKRLFELEVPEIHDGVVEIMAVSREAGNRSKIAVKTNDINVDPVGACVGPRGMRVQSIVEELKGEKIDIVEYSTDPERFIGNALSPARVVEVFSNEEETSARAVVPDHQLSLAIGREGQNARLAARLTGWKIDIKSESQMAELALLEAEKAAEERRRKQLEEAEQAEKDVEVDTIVSSDEDESIDESADEHVPEDIIASESTLPDAGPEQPDDHDLSEDVVDAESPSDDGDTEEIALVVPADLFADVEESRDKAEAPASARSRTSRAERKELESIISEDVLDEDEPLPSLFEEDDDEEDQTDDEVRVYTSGELEPESAIDAFKRRWGQQRPDEETRTDKGADEKQTKKKDDVQDKDKAVIRDLSQLASLLDIKDEDK